MQKLLVPFALLLFLLQSCSSSDSDTTPPDSMLVKRSAHTTPQGVFTTNYTYDGRKIIQFALTTTNFLRKGIYTYTGDLITKVEYFDINNTLTQRDVYEYNPDDTVASMVKLVFQSGTGTRVSLTHNPNGTITSITYSGDLTNQNTLVSNNTITLTNGEISSFVENIGTLRKSATFLYDNKNNPFKNVIGFAKIAYANEGFFSNATNQNLLQMNYSQAGGTVYTTNYIFTYNSNDFPLTQTTTNSNTMMRYEYY